MSIRGSGKAPHLLGAEPKRALSTVQLEEAGDTPILREYRAVKEQHRDAILLARLGDFYEMFGEDAEVAAPILGVALTGRRFGNAGRLPMCGVPHHAAAQYIRRLLGAGQRVALWDQLGEPGEGRTVRREVTRVLSPGTCIDADFLDEMVVARCLAIAGGGGRLGVAALDASTGSLELFEVAESEGSARVRDELLRLDVSELLVAEGADQFSELLPEVPRTRVAPALFDLQRADERLRRVFGVASLASLQLDEVPLARAAAGAVLAYCERAGLRLVPDFVRVQVRRPEGLMLLDPQTRRNLELFTPLSAEGPPLIKVLDHTVTPLGARLLRGWLQQPLADVDAIRWRADAVAELREAADMRRGLRGALAGVRDLERLVARAVQRTLAPRELGAVRDTCAALEHVQRALTTARHPSLTRAAGELSAPTVVREMLVQRLAADLPAGVNDGGAIAPGCDAELDSLIAAGADARAFIATLEQRERERTGIRGLRVGYNRVFGYYIEVPNSQRDSVPADFVRKQTLAGAERFLTADLKEQESIVLHARERALARERELLEEMVSLIAAHAPPLINAAAALAAVDVLQALAEVAAEEGWTRPLVDASLVIDIEGGRHPVVERAVGRNRFVANDCSLDAADRIIVLTGPNMAGKSTYLRQVAVIVLLAQIGSFVPAAHARVGVCDRIFTRIGAHDDLAAGMSTFMVEMAETAAILRQATERSLVILDEIGRGTSTYDGLSIAQAVIEHIHDAPQLGCRTLFATHYHELTGLADALPRVRNARLEVEEEGDRITFLHRIVSGGADRSYGIHVARLAGVPATVLGRARDLLDTLERSRPLAARDSDERATQLSLAITPPKHPAVTELAELEIDALTPLAALNKLAELQDLASK